MAETCIGELLRQYRDAAVRAGEISNPRRQNKAADEVHKCYKILRQTEEGRAGIIAMMKEPNRSLRGWAATHSLQWVPNEARKVLEELRDENVFPFSFSAKMTLHEFEKGRLNFDY